MVRDAAMAKPTVETSRGTLLIASIILPLPDAHLSLGDEKI